MRVSEAARKLGISPATVRKHIADGSLQAVKVRDAAAWPDGWRWDVDGKSVKESEGRWTGRGKYREQWVEDQVEELLVASPTTNSTDGNLRPLEIGEKLQTRILRLVLTAGFIIGVLSTIAQQAKDSSGPRH